jgi:hypothetical protein
MTIITIPTIYLDPDQPLRDLAVDAVIKGAVPSYTSTHTIYPIEPQFIDLDVAKSLIQFPDLTVERYPLLIEIGDETDLVPLALFGAKIADEDGGEHNVTWAGWVRSNYTVIERDGRKFICASANTGNDPELSELIPVFDQLIKGEDLPETHEE